VVCPNALQRAHRAAVPFGYMHYLHLRNYWLELRVTLGPCPVPVLPFSSYHPQRLRLSIASLTPCHPDAPAVFWKRAPAMRYHHRAAVLSSAQRPRSSIATSNQTAALLRVCAPRHPVLRTSLCLWDPSRVASVVENSISVRVSSFRVPSCNHGDGGPFVRAVCPTHLEILCSPSLPRCSLGSRCNSLRFAELGGALFKCRAAR
jgi:hypothetical protein